jgi:hypothetical protein
MPPTHTPAPPIGAPTGKMTHLALNVAVGLLNHPLISVAAVGTVYCSTEIGARLIKAAGGALCGAVLGMKAGFKIELHASWLLQRDPGTMPLSRRIGPAIGAMSGAAYALRS